MKQYDRFFKLAQAQAKKIVNDKEEMNDLAGKAYKKASMSEKLKDLMQQITCMTRMIKNVAKGRYKDYSKGAFAMIVAGMVYLVCPADAIPDVIPVVGYVDDAVVLSFIISRVDGELKKFMVWERGTGPLSSENN